MGKLGPYEVNTIVVGDCLEVLRQIPDGVFQMCATSPPYWGLRDYGIPPVVWGGAPLCEHEWADRIPHPMAKSGKHGPRSTIGAKEAQHQARQANMGQFCLRCNAWLGSLGLEPTPELYVEHIVEVFREVKRVLRDDGLLFLNLGDSYAGSRCGSHDYRPEGASISKSDAKYKGQHPGMPRGLKPKDLVGIPWMVALALRTDGWWLRSDIIWAKGVSFLPDYAGSCMPESVRDRPTKSHEYVFLLTKNRRYFYDQDAIREPLAFNRWSMSNKLGSSNRDIKTGQGAPGQSPHSWERKGHSGYFDGEGKPLFNPAGRNLRTVWVINPHPFPEAHFATFPPKLVEPMIKAGTSERGACPECGKAWVRVVERKPGTSKDCPKTVAAHHARGGTGSPVGTLGQSGSGRVDGTIRTVGWRPLCSCYDTLPFPKYPRQEEEESDEAYSNHIAPLHRVRLRLVEKWKDLPTIACIVLDLLAGAGTALMVADGLGRNWLGIEINPEYVEMALERIADDRKKRAQLELF